MSSWSASQTFLFIGHGSSGTKTAFLRFGGRDRRPEELARLTAVAPYIGLFACGGAGGKPEASYGGGSGWGPAQALLAAGARAVVAPVGDVEAELALELAGAWATAVEAGHPPIDAYNLAYAQVRARWGAAVESFQVWTRKSEVRHRTLRP